MMMMLLLLLWLCNICMNQRLLCNGHGPFPGEQLSVKDLLQGVSTQLPSQRKFKPVLPELQYELSTN